MNTQDQELNQQLIQNPNQEVVQLEQPIQLGDQTITAITIRKPNVKALSGVSLQAIYQHDVNALVKVLPRVTTPALTPQQVLDLDPVDFAQLGGHLVTFLYPQALQKAIKEEQQ
ncbi:phage tail assembly protein [Acinetobacter thermotolerans]|uniref:phage tail assembly protein n=1 Tax=Acinetobacter thermotolerans TaxID=3151487 RepID=UPI00325BC0FE